MKVQKNDRLYDPRADHVFVVTHTNGVDVWVTSVVNAAYVRVLPMSSALSFREAELARVATVKLRDSLRHAREAMAVANPFTDMKPLTEVRRDYMIQWRMVETVDNHGEPCGYCNGDRTIICNVYAQVYRAVGSGIEQDVWSTCDRCVIHSVDGVEDVDTRHIVIVERAQR